jgi:hypothetical protein
MGSAGPVNMGTWQQIDGAQRVVESCGADVCDHQRKMRAELNRQREKGK